MKYFYAYLLVINITGFLLMGYDKAKAKKGNWRVPERNFFVISLLGGALGVYAGMKTFRHKTKHDSFVIGIPLLLGINLMSAYFIFR